MWSERLGFAIVLGGSPSVCGQNVSGLLLFELLQRGLSKVCRTVYDCMHLEDPLRRDKGIVYGSGLLYVLDTLLYTVFQYPLVSQ